MLLIVLSVVTLFSVNCVVGAQQNKTFYASQQNKTYNASQQNISRFNRSYSTVCTADWCDPSHEPYPNIVSVMKGYHIVKGNPFPMGKSSDPGFATSFIFIPTTEDDNNRVALSTGITANNEESCTIKLSFDQVSTVKGYTELINKRSSWGASFTSNAEVDVSAEYAGIGAETTVPPIVDVSFGASEEFRDNEQFFTQEQGVLAMSESTCTQYYVRISKYTPPPFTDAFKAALSDLNDATSRDDQRKRNEFSRFIDEFGTHFIEQAKMGSRFSITRRYTQNEYHNSNSEDVKECNNARAKISLGASVGGESEGCEAISSSVLSTEVSGKQREYISSYGSKPAADTLAWSQQEFDKPLPIKMKLAPIVNLFTDDHMEKLKGIDYRAILRWFGPLYDTYCEINKAALGIESCHPTKEKGCGWNDNCIIGVQSCINDKSISDGYYCCTPKCLSSPCSNGGTCSDVLETCDYTCACREGYSGKSCTDRIVIKSVLTQEIKNFMLKNKGMSNDDFRYKLKDYLAENYLKYYFTVNSYNEVSGQDTHFMKGDAMITIYRTHGRNVVVGYTLRTKHLPSRTRIAEIEKEVVAKIVGKAKSAHDSLLLAYKELEKYNYPIALTLVVRFGCGLRTVRQSTSTAFFENYKTKDSHESSLVVQFGGV